MPRTELACGTCYDLRGFGGSRKGIENGRQKASQNDLKIELWALRGRIFEILGVFLRGLILDEFMICKKTTGNLKNSRRRRKRARPRARSAAEAGPSGGFWSLQESARVSKKDFRRLVPLQAGGAGSTSLARQPAAPHALRICTEIRKNEAP